VGLLFVSTTPDYAQESPGFETIGDFSRGGKSSMRSSCSDEPVNPDRSHSDLITGAGLASPPSKTRKLQIT
jgi:hypothetical protein